MRREEELICLSQATCWESFQNNTVQSLHHSHATKSLETEKWNHQPVNIFLPANLQKYRIIKIVSLKTKTTLTHTTLLPIRSNSLLHYHRQLLLFSFLKEERKQLNSHQTNFTAPSNKMCLIILRNPSKAPCLAYLISRNCFRTFSSVYDYISTYHQRQPKPKLLIIAYDIQMIGVWEYMYVCLTQLWTTAHTNYPQH